MKRTKSIACFAFLFLSLLKLNAQIAYYDAIELKQNLTANTFSGDAARILFKYIPIDKNIDNKADSVQALNDSLKKNPFLNAYKVGGIGQSAIGVAIDKAFSSIGNLNVTNFADGLAKFLVERSKEELNVAFFRKFQDFLKDYPELQVLFPATLSITSNIVSYKYAAMLPALRASFQKDLNDYSANLIQLRDVNSYIIPNNTEVANRIDGIVHFLNHTLTGRSVMGALVVTNSIVSGENAADAITALSNDKACDTSDNFSNAIRFADLLSQSLRSIDEDRIWITKKQVMDFVKNETALKLYLGLIYAIDKKNNQPIQFTLNNPVPFSLQQMLTDLSKKWGSESKEFVAGFTNVATSAADASTHAKGIIETTEVQKNAPVITYAKYASSLAQFLKAAVTLLPKSNSKYAALASDVQKFASVIDDAANSCYDIKSQNYTSLVVHTSNMLAVMLADKFDFKDDYLKYGTFMASVVEADNSDQVKAAIEAAVLPVGSSSIKRETYTNISINAYIGPFAGAEYLPKLQENKWAAVIGVTAPVGVAFSWGNKGKGKEGKKGGKSITLFVPLIDVGALATFRLGDDQSKVASEVKLKNIVSPGLYGYFGFGRCPISLGIGGQLGPEIREVTAQNVNIDKNYYFRFGLNLVVDIPLLNLYTKN